MRATRTTKIRSDELSTARGRSGAQRRTPEVEVAIGARIRAARVAAKMSQTALGGAIGITFQQVQKYETGKDRVAVSTLLGIAAALGVHPEAFFDYDAPVPVGPIPDVKRAFESANLLGRIRDPRVLKQILALVKALVDADHADIGRPNSGAEDPHRLADPPRSRVGRHVAS